MEWASSVSVHCKVTAWRDVGTAGPAGGEKTHDVILGGSLCSLKARFFWGILGDCAQTAVVDHVFGPTAPTCVVWKLIGSADFLILWTMAPQMWAHHAPTSTIGMLSGFAKKESKHEMKEEHP
jgi:hypothetical protein